MISCFSAVPASHSHGEMSSGLGLKSQWCCHEPEQLFWLVQLRTHPDQSRAGVVHATMVQAQSVAQLIHSRITGGLLRWISNTAFNHNAPPAKIPKSMGNGFLYVIQIAC